LFQTAALKTLIASLHTNTYTHAHTHVHTLNTQSTHIHARCRTDLEEARDEALAAVGTHKHIATNSVVLIVALNAISK
jgi:hypothetical protein